MNRRYVVNAVDITCRDGGTVRRYEVVDTLTQWVTFTTADRARAEVDAQESNQQQEHTS